MRTVVQAFCQRLGIHYNEDIVPYYKKGIDLYEELGDYILDKKRLTMLNEKYKVFRKHFDKVLMAADMIRTDKDLLVHTYIFVAIMKADADVNILETVNRERLDTDFAPLFAHLYFWEDMARRMEERNVPFEVISDTLNGYESEMNDYYDMHGRYGMRTYMDWFIHWIHGDMFRFGRLQFGFKIISDKIRVYQKGEDIKILIDGEYMHSAGMVFGSAGQTDEDEKFFAEIIRDGDRVIGYAANEYGECVNEKVTLVGYKEVLRSGDKALGVHIVSHEPFSQELCDASYEKAVEVIRKCYPEYDFKAIYCRSWLLEKRLRQIMGRDTNITKFAERYHVFPVRSDAEDVYFCLYNSPATVKKEELPENSSMQKVVKEYLRNGNYFYEKGGLFLV